MAKNTTDTHYRNRTVPEDQLKSRLGDRKTRDATAPTKTLKNGGQSKKPLIKASTEIRRGRKDSGPKGPRGRDFLEQDVRQQLDGGVGTHPQPGPIDDLHRALIQKIMGAERSKTFDRQQTMRDIADIEAKRKAKKSKQLPQLTGQNDNSGADDEIDEDN